MIAWSMNRTRRMLKRLKEGFRPYVIAEIGINHNGSLDICKQLIGAAKECGCDAIKLQKRTIDIVYTKEELDAPRDSPFGKTNRDLKEGLEFSLDEYTEIDRYCKNLGIDWFASPWDVPSVDFLERFDVPCHKVASAMLTHWDLLERLKGTGKTIIMSTGMSTLNEIDKAVNMLEGVDLVLMHTTSTYPSIDVELNLEMINTLRHRYHLPVGYSGHEVGIFPTVASVVGYKACCIERHLTLDRAMFGSDQSASLEPQGMKRVVDNIEQWLRIKGSGEKVLLKSEEPVMRKLRYFREEA